MPREGAAKGRKKRPLCHTCDKPIHVPAGWSAGSAVRKHYWKHHPKVMQVKSADKAR